MEIRVIRNLTLMQITTIILKREMENHPRLFFMKLMLEDSIKTLECINLMELRFLNMIWEIVVRMCREILNIHGNGLSQITLSHLNM